MSNPREVDPFMSFPGAREVSLYAFEHLAYLADLGSFTLLDDDERRGFVRALVASPVGQSLLEGTREITARQALERAEDLLPTLVEIRFLPETKHS